MTAKPRVAVLIGAAWPDNDASGPVQSVRQIALRFADRIHFELFARSGPPKGLPIVGGGRRVEQPWGGTTYLDIGLMGARGLGAAVVESKCDRIWLNSAWDREFTLPALALRRMQRGIPQDALLSTRGEFAPGALSLHAARKKALLAGIRTSGLLAGITLHATGDAEAADVARTFPHHPMIIAGNIRSLPELVVQKRNENAPIKLLFLGRISPVKGLHNALLALARYGGCAQFEICGPIHDQEYFEYCSRLAEGLPSSIVTNFVGPVANADAAERYASADLFLNPSASENFGHTIFESLAAGTPVLTGLATPWNGLEESCAGFNVSSDDHDAIAQAISRFARLDRAVMARWRRAARKRAEIQANDVTTLEVWEAWLTGNLAGRTARP